MAFKLWKNAAFDGVTGVETDESLASLKEEELTTKLQEAAALAHLDQSPGWQLIKHSMQEDVIRFQTMLLDSQNFEHTRKVQECIKARTGLLNWISTKIAEGQSLSEEHNQDRAKPRQS